MRISDWSSDVCSSDLRALAQVGILVKIVTPKSHAFGMVNALTMPEPSSPPSPTDIRLMQIDLFGEMVLDEAGKPGPFQRGCAVMPSLGQAVYASTSEDLVRIYSRPSNANVALATIHTDSSLPPSLPPHAHLCRPHPVH